MIPNKMGQTPAVASPPSPPPAPQPGPKLLNPQPKAYTIPSTPSAPQPNPQLLKQQSESLTKTAKLLNPKAQSFRPLSPLENQKYSSSKALFVPHELFEQQQRQYTLAPVMTWHFAFHHVYYCQPIPVWSSQEAKVEFFNVFQPTVQGNAVPYFLGSSGDENYVEEEVVEEDNVDGYGKKKMDERIKRFVSPKWRSQRRNVVENNNKICAPKTFVPKKKVGEMIPDGNTTLMIKNIPNQFQRHDLLQILDDHCRKETTRGKLHSNPCRSEYDFVYLPMDFGYRANLGYAFVNFTTAVGAIRFSKAFHRYEWDAHVPGSKKICQVSGATIQGKDALMYHFELSKFRCHTDDYLPVILSPPRDGWKLANPTIVGKRIDTGPAAAIHRRKTILMMRNRRLQ